MSIEATRSSDKQSIELSVEQKIRTSDNPHRDPQILEYLYVEKGLSLRGVADRLECDHKTVSRWLRKHGIERRDQAEATKEANRVDHPKLSRDGSGYAIWKDTDHEAGETVAVRVHQLAAISAGADPHEVFADGTHVHHRNTHKSDNRGDNLEILSTKEHSGTHAESVWRFDGSLGCRVLQTAEGGSA